jgi:hydroxymethylpyrimidine/phosphomethylpyrimidine kinase
VVIKGGHMPGDKIVDLLFDGRDVTTFTSPRIQTTHTHGTGCTFAASLAAGLALGRSLVEATEGAKSYVERAIRHAHRLGHGAGALDHFAKD